ncbi:MAG: hypothetical protein ACLGIF_05225 [Actinomycetes bacterium]
MQRPIGWWLKEADARLEAAFAATLRTYSLTRRGWQILAQLAAGGLDRTALVERLSPFDPPLVIEEVLEDLAVRGWLAAEGERLRLTPEGERVQATLAAEVDAIREQVAAALPGEDYATLVRLLAHLVDALPTAS